MEIGGAMMEPKFDAVHAWKPKVPVIIERMEDFLARRREKVLVEVEVLETHLSCPTDVEGIIGVLAWTPRYARHATARAPERYKYSQLMVWPCMCSK